MRQLVVLVFLVFNLFAYSAEPTTPASNITFPFVGCNEFTMKWTNGNGSERVVFVREASAFTDVPVKNEFYSDNAIFGIGEDIKGDKTHWCVYRGTGNTVTVKGLKKVTKYYVAVFEYNSAPGGIYDYLTSSYPADNVTTKSIIADFTITPTAQCFNGNSFQFTNKSTCDLSPISYVWKFGDGDSSKVKDPTHSYLSPGPKPVKLIATATGCYTTVIISDTVHPQPVAKFDLDKSKTKNDSIQCYFGNRFTFKNATTLLDISVGPSSMRYEWHMDNGFTQTGYTADRQFANPGVQTVKLVVISNRGCKDSTSRVYKVLPRAIDPSMVVFNQKSMCLSANKFTFTNNSPSSINSSWRFREEFGSFNFDSVFNKTATYSFSKTGKYYVILKAYDIGGCLDQLRDSVDVFSNTNVSFKGLKNQYCLNEPISKLVPTPGKGEFSGTNVSGIDSSFTPASIGTFKVMYISSKGSCKDTFLQTTSVFNRPVVKLGNDTVICKDFPLQLNVNPAYVSTWFPSGTTASFLNISQSGKYSVISKDGICSDTDEIVIKSLNSPTLKLTRDTTLCGGSFLKFNLKVEDGTIIWNDGFTSGDRNVEQSGIYRVFVSNKCGSVSDSFNLVVEETACKVFFPNAFTPNGDLLNDTWQPYGKYEFIQMNIFNRWGEKVYASDKSPIWDGYDHKNLCLDGVYDCVFEYLMQDGNSMKRVTEGIIIHLVR